MTELAYGHGIKDPPRSGKRLHDIDLLPDIAYAEQLLVLADHAVRHEPRQALDLLLFALCWARFDLTVTGNAARQTLCLQMDRLDVRLDVEQALSGLVDDDVLAEQLAEEIVSGTLHLRPPAIHEAA